MHKTAKRTLLGRGFVIVERDNILSKMEGKPLLEIHPIGRFVKGTYGDRETIDYRKKGLRKKVKKLSGNLDSVAWVADSTNLLYKGGERRI